MMSFVNIIVQKGLFKRVSSSFPRKNSHDVISALKLPSFCDGLRIDLL